VGALLGVGLSITREGSSALRGFAMAVGIMVVYYLVGQMSVVAGKHGILPPVAAGCLPTFFFLGWGVWELHRKR
jgi:lipopolysaccharide export LptBFGC system permease protein LptF